MSESNTFTYDMVKTLRNQGANLTVEQIDLAIATVEAEIKSDAADLQKLVESIKPTVDGAKLAGLVIEAGRASGKVHSTEKSPFPKDADAAAKHETAHEKIGETLSTVMPDGRKIKHAIAKVLDHERHLSKLMSWRERLLMGLSIAPTPKAEKHDEADESPEEGGLADEGGEDTEE